MSPDALIGEDSAADLLTSPPFRRAALPFADIILHRYAIALQVGLELGFCCVSAGQMWRKIFSKFLFPQVAICVLAFTQVNACVRTYRRLARLVYAFTSGYAAFAQVDGITHSAQHDGLHAFMQVNRGIWHVLGLISGYMGRLYVLLAGIMQHNSR